MKYQLVLQFPSDVFDDERAAASLEQELIDILGDDAYVDGIDLGLSMSSVFIFSEDPAVTFHQVTPLLERKELLESVTAAHRQSDIETFTVIWPLDCRKEFRIPDLLT